MLRYTIRRPGVIAMARAFHALVFIGTSIYCLLIYSPFTFQQFIKPQVSAGLAALAVWHSAIYWLAVAITVLTIAPYLEHARARAAGWIYLAGTTALGIWMTLTPVLTQPDPARPNLLYALLALLPPMCLGVFDHLAVDRPPLAAARDRRSAAACWATAAIVWLAFLLAVPVRIGIGGGIELASSDPLVLGLIVSAVAHLTAFAFVWIGLMAASGVGSLTRDPGRTEYVALAALSVLATTIVTMRLVLAPIAITGPAGWMVSAGAALSMTSMWSGIARYRAARAGVAADRTALDAWLAPIVTTRSRGAAIVGVAVAMVVSQLLINRVATFDWDFMIQKLTALAVWVVVFAFVHAAAREPAARARPLWMAPALVLALFTVEVSALPRVTASIRGARLNPEFALDAYAAVDPSYRVIRDAMRPGNSGDAVEFYAYLRANAGVHDAHVEPAPIDFSQAPHTMTGPSPHIFLFIVDSLRRDYLSPHNAAIDFTPAIDAFADDSFAFARAFTRYGGTGLAVPSIWAGGLLFHKEYVTPFEPMNALKKLLDRRGYRQFIAADHITDQLFVPAHDTVWLARSVSEMQHTFCGTIDEMSAALDARAKDDRRPVFGHMRTLDLHIGNIWSAKVPPGESYPGFFEPYAARVRAIDTCFGRFIAYLKTSGLYEQSVVILTSDHGDSLGEGGRWGHGFTVFPEVMRIPLIVHLPPALRAAFGADLTQVSFATDVTPTLYALLGEEPRELGPQFGSPLVAPPGADRSARKRESFLIASSYGPTWGLIENNGRSMYIADATYGRDYAFDLRAGAAGRRIEVTDADRAASRRRIRDEVAAIAARYHFTPTP